MRNQIVTLLSTVSALILSVVMISLSLFVAIPLMIFGAGVAAFKLNSLNRRVQRANATNNSGATIEGEFHQVND